MYFLLPLALMSCNAISVLTRSLPKAYSAVANIGDRRHFEE